jgi:uncharacterized integral membrane protein
MRWINMAVTAIFVVVTPIFTVQNFQSVTVSFLSFNVSATQAAF